MTEKKFEKILFDNLQKVKFYWLKWRKKNMFLRGLNKNWKNAYRAEAKFYSGNNNIFGVFPLTENTDTIFIVNLEQRLMIKK